MVSLVFSIKLTIMKYSHREYQSVFHSKLHDIVYLNLLFRFSTFIIKYCFRSIRSGGQINDGKWHPICFTWSSQYGQYKFFKDGKIVDYGDGFKSGKTILGGGTWVLGQDQDAQRGGFDVNQMVQGEMTDVNIWNKVLTEREILEISANCLFERKGSVKSWNDFIVGVRGDVKKLQKPTCA